MIKGSRLGFSYFWDGESIPVFEQANIELKEGEWTAILGCNGCGKSTLVRLMNGLLPLQDGNLSVNGINAGIRIISLFLQCWKRISLLVWKTLRFRNERLHRR